jgi:hypothetical protein
MRRGVLRLCLGFWGGMGSRLLEDDSVFGVIDKGELAVYVMYCV